MAENLKFILEDRFLKPGDITEIKEWLKYNDVDKKLNKDEFTLLSFAVCDGVLEIVELLIKEGADLCYSGGYAWGSYMELAATNGRLEVIKYLLNNGFDRKKFLKDNSLIDACGKNFVDVAKYLIQQGKDIEQPLCQGGDIEEGYTPLRMATGHKCLDCVKFLCELGANVNTKGFDTPLYTAAANGSLEIVKILVSYGADVNLTDEKDVTPYYIATRYGQKETAEYLLSCGADPTIVPFE